jgi:homoaconitase/3-isopropylmalate dehydratase large subunit
MKKRKKIPSKSDLLQLQKLYKTDEKIGERLGGVPAYLVAYWRRKKNIPKHSQPKFSDREVRNLWERFGDDEKAGLELGISKAAFYNWRRRYGIRQKPAFLKLEQLELDFPGIKFPGQGASLYGKQTVAQKIIARAADCEKVTVGEEVDVDPDLAIICKGLGEVVSLFKRAGVEYVWNPTKIVTMYDGWEAAGENSGSTKRAPLRDFCKRQSIAHTFEYGEGDCHQVALERGISVPGNLTVGSSFFISGLGAISSLAFQYSDTELASLWAGNKLTRKVPPTVRIEMTGRRSRGVYTRDIALSILKQLSEEQLIGRVIEYAGSLISHMSISERFTLSSLSRLVGAVAAICPYDSTTRRYLNGRVTTAYKAIVPDKNAEYDGLFQINIDQLVPQMLAPGNPDKIRAVAELVDLPIVQAVVGGAANGRFDDLRVAAEFLKGRHVHEDCRLVIIPGSRAVYLEALKKGLIRVFVEAGAMVMNPGCHPFLETKLDSLQSGDRLLTTASPLEVEGQIEAEIYYCSPATAVASAIIGIITDPERFARG